jgi:mono/diheme cytochrome c family protein
MMLVMPAISQGSSLDQEILDGKALFEANKCDSCHGKDGKVTKYGRKLKPFPARDLSALAGRVSRDELRRIITYGVHKTSMTSKKYTLDPLEIEAIIDYIYTLKYEPDLANGKKRFKEVCASCHGVDGRANTGLGAKNLVYSKLSLEQIVHTMRYGRPGTLMTSKRHQLTNTEIADIASYVMSLRYVGDPGRGKKLYASSCKSCHATPRDIKLIGNAAQPVKLISEVDDHVLDLRIRHGRHVTRAGEKVSKLTPDDVQDIIAYLRQETK